MKPVLRTLFAAFVIGGTVLGQAEAGATGAVVELESRVTGNRVPWRGGAGDALRFQCLWLQSDINAAGYVNRIDFYFSSGSVPASFYNCRVLLCHSSNAELESTFADNYTGNTPVEVFNGTMTLDGATWLDIRITPGLFDYNNTDNLLMEISWDGDSGNNVYCYQSNGAYRRLYSFDSSTAAEGTPQAESQYIRLHIGTLPGVSPTSLGRVRAIYK
jgi:hypothetical protein